MKKCLYLGYKGNLEAYIYIWFSKMLHMVYVGETNNINGVIGRANQHVSRENGTLYNCFYNEGYDIAELNDLLLLSFPLPREKKFRSEETAYRISVEYLVQKTLLRLRSCCKNPYRVISQVTTGPFIEQKRLIDIANKISNDFFEIYEEI